MTPMIRTEDNPADPGEGSQTACPQIELRNVSFAYPEAEPALLDLSLTIEEGDKAVLLGVNGSGKSTLLRLMNGLLFPASGSIRYRGEELSSRRLRNRDWARRFRSEVVLLFQNPDAMLFNPTVHDEIAFGLRQLRVGEVNEQVRRWADRLEITSQLDQPPFRLSGGEKQKVCLAALLALEPSILLLDEPTANLDPRSTGWLVDFLDELEVTIVTTTHNLGLAGELGERTLVLGEDHRLVFDGAIEDLLEDDARLQAANLVHVHRHRHRGVSHRHAHAHDWS